MIHSLLNSLDNCNSILVNALLGLLKCLQSVMHSSARLDLLFPPMASVSKQVRDQLHWLQVQQRIIFNLCTVAHK